MVTHRASGQNYEYTTTTKNKPATITKKKRRRPRVKETWEAIWLYEHFRPPKSATSRYHIEANDRQNSRGRVSAQLIY